MLARSPTLVPPNAAAIARMEELKEWRTKAETLLLDLLDDLDPDLLDCRKGYSGDMQVRIKPDAAKRGIAERILIRLEEEAIDQDELDRLEEEARG